MAPISPDKRQVAGRMPTGIVLMIGLFIGAMSICGLIFDGPGGAGATSAGTNEKRMLGLKEQSAFIQSEIDGVRQNLEWLELKIKNLEDFNRFVPPKLYDSLGFKKEKIASLTALKKRVDALGGSLAPPNGEGETNFEKGLDQKIRKSGLNDWVALVRDGDKIIMENRLPILFAQASAELAGGYDPFIKKWAGFLKGYDVRIMVRGYADTDPINTDKYPSNFELGAARAGAVVQRFIAHGVKPDVCKISSTGEHRFQAGKKMEWKNLQRHANVFVVFRPMDD